jgi:hypothetical protein
MLAVCKTASDTSDVKYKLIVYGIEADGNQDAIE